MKKTIIATAVSVALGAPVAAQAEVTVYGFVHNMIHVSSSDGGPSTTNMSTRGSRFGFKASSDLGNGLTASLHQEFGILTDAKIGKSGDDDDADTTNLNTRIGTVGVSGGFGSINAGRQWSTLYNTIGVYMDPTSTVAIGGYGGHYITSNTIQYTNSLGPVSVSLDARVDDAKDGEGDGSAIGVSVAAHPNVTLAAAMDTTNGTGGGADTDKTGFAVQVSMGNYYGSYAVHDKDTGTATTDYSVFLLGGSFGNTNAFIGFGNTDDNAGDESDTVTLHIDHALMGSGLKLLYEGRSTDGNMDGDMNDSTDHVLGLKLSF